MPRLAAPQDLELRAFGIRIMKSRISNGTLSTDESSNSNPAGGSSTLFASPGVNGGGAQDPRALQRHDHRQDRELGRDYHLPPRPRRPWSASHLCFRIRGIDSPLICVLARFGAGNVADVVLGFDTLEPYMVRDTLESYVICA
jgi:hypothetical protein